MNLLYLLGSASNWQDNDIRYSLRSAHAHLGVHSVTVVGERPGWLRNITHVPADDPYPQPVACTLHKLIAACSSSLVPEDFVLMNDDFIFLADHPAPLPTRIIGTIQQRIDRGPQYESFYYQLMQRALQVWRSQGIAQPLDFDGHHPMPMCKKRVLAMTERWGGSGSIYAWRSYYGNMFARETMYSPDPKLHLWQQPHSTFISLGAEVTRSSEFRRWIDARFPEPSPYEQP